MTKRALTERRVEKQNYVAKTSRFWGEKQHQVQ